MRKIALAVARESYCAAADYRSAPAGIHQAYLKLEDRMLAAWKCMLIHDADTSWRARYEEATDLYADKAFPKARDAAFETVQQLTAVRHQQYLRRTL